MKRCSGQFDVDLLRLVVLICAMLIGQSTAYATEILVSTASEITAAMLTAKPGDSLIMTDGTWTNQQIQFAGFGGMDKPITLRAQTPGQVLLNGNSTINISGDWLVVDGLKFEGGALGTSDHIVEFRGSNGEATNSRFTNSAIINYNPADINTRYFWVSMYGHNNRVDHNRFEGQNHSGVTVTVWRNDPGADNHLIDANHFIDRPEGNGNGFETIRVGTSTESLSNSFTTVQNNLFERTDGEIEIISNKSGGNIYRYNTFRESAGTLTLRHGNDTRVEGNFFLGENKQESGAIRVIGERQTIVNNYIADVDNRAGGAISISAGVPNSAVNEYFQVKDAMIAHNTLVHTLGAMITFDDGLGSSGRTLLAENVTVANNLLKSSGPSIFEGNEGAGWNWSGNIAYGGNLGPKAGETGISINDPELQMGGDGLWRPGATSPAIDGGQGDYTGLISDDMDGQPRLGLFDVGADEYSLATIVRKPLEAGDVGPAWLKAPVDPPSGGGCFANGCAIQAEDYSELLDPNGDGFLWKKLTVSESLGGEVLAAPNGDRINLPADLQDTIAVYDLTFEQPGTYRAYYRARGFNGSTDSIYVPDDFAIDPDNAETLSSDGKFRWEVGDTFTINSGNVDVPLEFRIGRREQMAQLDAVVLDLDLSLTAEELDALFEVYDLADFNEDSSVDGLDLASWRSGFGILEAAVHADGDADEDGDVDGKDFLSWQHQYKNGAFTGVVQVPEPTSGFLLWACLMTGVLATCRSNCRWRFLGTSIGYSARQVPE